MGAEYFSRYVSFFNKKVYYEDCIQPEFYIIVKRALWKGEIAYISFSAEHNHYLSLFQGF